jgi:hypothetical protein
MAADNFHDLIAFVAVAEERAASQLEFCDQAFGLFDHGSVRRLPARRSPS